MFDIMKLLWGLFSSAFRSDLPQCTLPVNATVTVVARDHNNSDSIHHTFLPSLRGATTKFETLATPQTNLIIIM